MSVPRHALVLTAGLGTRLWPLSLVRAKPAIPVAGDPLIRRIVRWLAAAGATDVVLNLHHLPHTLTAVVGDGSDLGTRVRYSWEQPVVLGSAGGPRHALPLIEADTFLLVNGDTFTDVDLRRLADRHAGSGAHVTLALVPNREPHRYGGVRLDGDGCVTGFLPRGAASDGSYHFVGVQIVRADVFASLPAGEPARSIGGVYDALIARAPGSVRGFVCDATFWDVGTPADYWHMSQAFLAAQAPDGWRGRNVHIDPTAAVRRSILWDDAEVGRDCVIDGCILADGVRVRPGSQYRDAVLVRAGGAAARAGSHVDGDLLVTPLAIAAKEITADHAKHAEG